jgi:uncharacterized protein
MEKSKPGQITWHDLTIKDAEGVSEFYKEVVGWEKIGLSMGDYADYCMNIPGTEETVTGICHARGVNTYIPPQWLMYVTVADLDASLEKVKSLGGKIIGEKRKYENGIYCLIQDPAGAHVMLCG